MGWSKSFITCTITVLLRILLRLREGRDSLRRVVLLLSPALKILIVLVAISMRDHLSSWMHSQRNAPTFSFSSRSSCGDWCAVSPLQSLQTHPTLATAGPTKHRYSVFPYTVTI